MFKLKVLWKRLRLRHRKSEDTVGKEDSTNTTTDNLCSLLLSAKERDAIHVCTQFMNAHNSHDVDFLKHHCATNSLFCFLSDELIFEDYLDTIRALVKSFPNFEIETDDFSIATTSNSSDDDDDILVNVSGIRAKGTHDGAPFAFGPYPEIPTSGVHVEEKGGYVTSMHVRNNKIRKLVIEGGTTIDEEFVEAGPAFFYTKIGGILF